MAHVVDLGVRRTEIEMTDRSQQPRFVCAESLRRWLGCVPSAVDGLCTSGAAQRQFGFQSFSGLQQVPFVKSLTLATSVLCGGRDDTQSPTGAFGVDDRSQTHNTSLDQTHCSQRPRGRVLRKFPAPRPLAATGCSA